MRSPPRAGWKTKAWGAILTIEDEVPRPTRQTSFCERKSFGFSGLCRCGCFVGFLFPPPAGRQGPRRISARLAAPLGVSRKWGDEDASDMTGLAVAGRGDRGWGGFCGWSKRRLIAPDRVSTSWRSGRPATLAISRIWG